MGYFGLRPSVRTLAKAVAPFLAPLRMRVERRQDLANMKGELLPGRRKGDRVVDKSIGGVSEITSLGEDLGRVSITRLNEKVLRP